MRTELTNDFITGLKNLFAEHYIELPDDKVDVVESLSDQVAELTDKLNAVIDENVTLKANLTQVSVEAVVEELASDLALTQQEKFKSLAEELDFDGDLEVYKKKLQTVKETYFKEETTPRESNIDTENFDDETPETKAIDPTISRYVQAISRTVK